MSNVAQQRATECFNTLQQWYLDGQWQDAGFWNNANSLQAVLDYFRWSGRTGADDIARSALKYYRDETAGGFGYFDDVQWWAISFIEAYQLTNDGQYLDQAKSIFDDVSSSAWSDVCNGGVRWKNSSSPSDPPYKNAITNELFLMLSTSLYLVTRDTRYSDWAGREWHWFQRSGLINSESLINDGLTKPGSPNACQNNHGTTWTYNQGVILGGLVNLYQINGDRSLLDTANKIAEATMVHLVKNGVLQEPCEKTNNCSATNAPQFKGVFIRYLRLLAGISGNPEYSAFIQKNADSAWANNRQSDGGHQYFGLAWYGPFDRKGTVRQTSALDLFNAAAAPG